MPLLGGEDKVTEGKGFHALFTPNKLLTRLPILLAQKKAGNNSCISRQILHHLLYKYNKIIDKVNQITITMDENKLIK